MQMSGTEHLCSFLSSFLYGILIQKKKKIVSAWAPSSTENWKILSKSKRRWRSFHEVPFSQEQKSWVQMSLVAFEGLMQLLHKQGPTLYNLFKQQGSFDTN
jgi:hypothetical protein